MERDHRIIGIFRRQQPGQPAAPSLSALHRPRLAAKRSVAEVSLTMNPHAPCAPGCARRASARSPKRRLRPIVRRRSRFNAAQTRPRPRRSPPCQGSDVSGPAPFRTWRRVRFPPAPSRHTQFRSPSGGVVLSRRGCARPYSGSFRALSSISAGCYLKSCRQASPTWREPDDAGSHRSTNRQRSFLPVHLHSPSLADLVESDRRSRAEHRH